MRKTDVLYFFVDGVLATSCSYTPSFLQGAEFIFGGQSLSGSRNAGYAFDEIRITPAVARYDEAGFTPPVAEYPTQGPPGFTGTYISNSASEWLPVVGTGGAATNLPVVQSVKVSSAGAIESSTEAGWGCSKVGVGLYDITFPTAADSELEQWVVGGRTVTGATASDTSVDIASLTATTCRVTTFYSGATPGDTRFSLIRRLPDAPATALVATQPTGTVQKVEIARITDPDPAGFDFTGLNLTGYDRIIVAGEVRGTTPGVDNVHLKVEFNGDTTATNYTLQIQWNSTSGIGSIWSNSNEFTDFLPGSTALAGSYANFEAYMENPAGSGLKSIVVREYHLRNTSLPSMGDGIVFHDTLTAPITSVKFYPPADGFLGTLILYGEKTA